MKGHPSQHFKSIFIVKTSNQDITGQEIDTLSVANFREI